ncbi:MAG: GHKL domain-containing protein [Lachnospiraceae bacterium]|nr:GHKL domain-containing protein [Lachnospiraceae bacterium]
MREVFWGCYENLINILQAFILVATITSIYGVKYWKKKPFLTVLLGTTVYSILLILSNHIVGFEGFGIIVFGVLVGIYAIFMLQGKWIGKIPVAMVETLILIIVSTVVSLFTCCITGIDGEMLAYSICIERFMALIMAQVILALCMRIFVAVLKRQKNPFPFNKNEGSIFTLIFLTSLVIFFCITQTVFTQELSERNTTRLLCSCGGLVLLNIICFYMLNDLTKKRKIATENLILKEQALYQEKYAKEVKQQYDEIKRLRHDMKQQYSVLENLLVQRKYQLMDEYLLKSIQGINSKESFIYIKNEYINAILNRKINHAREEGIEVSLNSIEEFLGVDEMDMCNLLGNLFDNAREACVKVTGKRKIELNLFQDADKIHVEIKNTIKESVLKNNEELKSDKKDRDEHGYGMKTIKEIVEKYEGLMDIWEEGGKFCIGIVLYIDK